MIALRGRLYRARPGRVAWQGPHDDAERICLDDDHRAALRNEITLQQVIAQEGYLSVPEEPGLGMELDSKAVEKYRVA